MDIIWACASTIFICVWVMLHLNIPAEKDGKRTIFLRKTKWFILAMLAPELLLLFAGGQWAAARRSVDEMRDLQMKDWTMSHGFYAESGGFMLVTKDSVRFPVTARQMHYLIKHGHIPRPTISSQEISDKSKADGFAKALALAQSGWFAVQISARGIQHLAVTLLELSTICLMTCTAAALFFWFHKPLDVRIPTLISCNRTVAELNGAKESSGSWKYTPLDFCEVVEYTSPQFPFQRLWSEQDRPLPRIPNDRDSLLHSWKIIAVISIPTAAFGAMQLIAWDFAFPTETEKNIWRYTCLGGLVVLATGCLLEAAAIVISKYTLSGMQTFHNYKTRWPVCLLFLGAGLLYIVARMIVITEVIISLRALPDSCFETVQWTSFLPHI